MARNRIEQIPAEYREDLNPDYEAGENNGPPRPMTRPAAEFKELHDRFPKLRNDQLRQVPVLVEGNRLEQGATYFDLAHPEQGEFTAMGDQVAGPENRYVPKSETDFELWDFLTGVKDPYRLGRFSSDQ